MHASLHAIALLYGQQRAVPRLRGKRPDLHFVAPSKMRRLCRSDYLLAALRYAQCSTLALVDPDHPAGCPAPCTMQHIGSGRWRPGQPRWCLRWRRDQLCMWCYGLPASSVLDTRMHLVAPESASWRPEPLVASGAVIRGWPWESKLGSSSFTWHSRVGTWAAGAHSRQATCAGSAIEEKATRKPLRRLALEKRACRWPGDHSVHPSNRCCQCTKAQAAQSTQVAPKQRDGGGSRTCDCAQRQAGRSGDAQWNAASYKCDRQDIFQC